MATGAAVNNEPKLHGSYDHELDISCLAIIIFTWELMENSYIQKTNFFAVL